MGVCATPFLRELTDTVVSAGALLPAMRLFICGGAPVAPELVRRAAQAIPGCAISRAFGSSEAPTVTLGVRGVEELELGATTDGRIVNNERSEEHTSELQTLMRNSYAVFCLKKKTNTTKKRNSKPHEYQK